MSIEVKAVSKIYGTQYALDHVSFKAETGRITGFLGPNGAGKSTMMKIITGYLAPNSGEVWVNGMHIVDDSMKVKKVTGYLPENNPLYHDLYVVEYLNFTGEIYKLGRRLKSRVAEIIELTGLKPEQHKKIGALSKGYRQRVGLAQALLHDPQVLILDEPTSGLDPNQIVEIRNLIARIGEQKTILLSTHIMQEVEAICHDIIIINKGKIVAHDSTQNIQLKTGQNVFTVEVEFDKPADLQLINKIEGVQNSHYTDDGKILINYRSDVDVRPAIFNFAVEHQLKVFTLQKREKSLEEIFQLLTV